MRHKDDIVKAFDIVIESVNNKIIALELALKGLDDIHYQSKYEVITEMEVVEEIIKELRSEIANYESQPKKG